MLPLSIQRVARIYNAFSPYHLKNSRNRLTNLIVCRVPRNILSAAVDFRAEVLHFAGDANVTAYICISFAQTHLSWTDTIWIATMTTSA